MATESPMIMVESSGPGKWPSSRNATTFTLPLNNMAAEDLGLLLKSHRLDRDQRETVPNRSGSAPPSMEGSFAAIGNLLAQQNSGLNASLADFSSAIESCESEEQLRADPAYFAYYCSNVNLNPRLPPPLISRENQRLVRHIGGFGNIPKLTSFDDSSNSSMDLSRVLLSTHKEEPEDDRSSPQASDDWIKSSGTSMIGEKTASLAGRHKSLVDLIQEDFPRTPSPVYNLSCSSSHATTEESIDIVLNSMSLSDPSANILRLSESNSGFVNSCTDASSLDPHNIGLMSSDPSTTSFSRIQNRDGIPPLQKDEPSSNSTKLVDDVPINAAAQSDNTIMESITRGGSKVSDLVSENDKNKQKPKHSYERNMQQHHPSQQGGTANQVHGVRAQLVSQGMNSSYSGLDVSRGHPKFSSMEVQPPLHSPGLTPPLYATAAAYMTSGNPYYPNLQPSGIFTPQYNMGGYALSSALYPPYIAGYPSHGAIPMSFDATSSQGLNVRTAGISAGESISHVGHMQHANKFYGQHGLMLQPPFVDPLHMQYFQNSFEGVYGPAGQYGPLATRGAFGDQGLNIVSKESSAYMDENFLLSTNGSLSIPSPRKGGITSTSYNGGSPSMGFMTQFPASPVSPMPRSPVGATNYPGRRDEMRFPQDSIRHAEVYNAWQGQRGGSGSHDLKRHSFLEELKSTNSRKFELSDITGRIVEFSVDQHGSRFIQQKLENCTAEEKGSVFKEVIPHASKLMIDVFGNYVIQKFFEHGSPEQRAELADQLAGQILPLSLQMYGCRVIQKALEVIELDQKTQLVHELDGNVMRCVRDQNGNHVIQKCIECVPTKKIGFIISAFRGHVATLSTHPYGCRVIQRILEHCSDEVHSQCIVDEILESACVLAQDQYGNYVIQHVLERGKPHERCQIISKLTGKIVQMSQHKYASNVVEKCLEYGDAAERELFIGEIIGQSEENDNLLVMMKDQFANFVVQKILETSSDKQREILLNRIRIHLQALKKYTYGKHIVARFEQLAGNEIQASEPLGS